MADIRDEIREIAGGLQAWAEHLRMAGIPSVLRERADICASCPLNSPGKAPVKGAGSADARIFIVQGHPLKMGDGPFEGKDGDLLSNMIKAMGKELGMDGLSEGDVYVTHAIRCPFAGAPDVKAAEACRAYLDGEIGRVMPDVIIAFGPEASFSTLGSPDIATLRGRFHAYKGVPLMPTYGPGELNRSPELKKGAWDDLKMVVRLIKEKGGKPLPPPPPKPMNFRLPRRIIVTGPEII